MKKNVGKIDRILRIILAAVFAGLYFAKITEGTLGLILLVLGGVFAVTAAVGFCPLYKLVGLNSCPVKK